MPFLCLSTKKGRKKRNSDVPSEASLPPAVLTMNGGGFCFGKSPPSAGHISHPADGFAVGKCFCFPFLFEICASRGQNLLLCAPTYAHTALARLAKFLVFCVYGRSPSFARSRNAFYATSWHFPRSSQEGNLDVPSKTSPPPAVLTMNGGDFAFGKRPPSWAHISHAQDGFAVGKIFCYPVGADVISLAR